MFFKFEFFNLFILIYILISVLINIHMLTRHKRMATGYAWIGIAGVSAVVGYFNISSIDSDQKRHIADDITYLRQQRAWYEYYGDMARFTQEEINARE